MTTKDSPLPKLQAQAELVAQKLKSMDRLAQARPDVVFGIVMDDKVLKITMAWATIRGMTEAELARWIVGQMREAPADGH